MNTIELRLDQHSAEPLYQQIADNMRQLIATERFKPGDHLPTVRQLAHSLGINQNTVIRAYLELEQERVVVSRRGGGTIVAMNTDDPAITADRQRRLSNIVSNDIVQILSLGYGPEELEAAFYLHLARWREERKTITKAPEESAETSRKTPTIRVVGSHDLALSILVDLLKHKDKEVKIEVTHAGSLGGLIALQEERADLAGIHLMDEETGEYNYPYVKRILPGREVAIVHLAYRIQGLMFVRGNPKEIKGIVDLKRPDVTFVNRQKGAGTRVLLDIQLRHLGIAPHEINGYNQELDTHLAVGMIIARGEADVGLGIKAAARSCHLDFLPLFRERYDLVMLTAKYHSPLMAPLLEIISSDDFRKSVTSIGGYDTDQTGSASFLN